MIECRPERPQQQKDDERDQQDKVDWQISAANAAITARCGCCLKAQ
jgi:hypothetical protein